MSEKHLKRTLAYLDLMFAIDIINTFNDGNKIIGPFLM